MLMREPTITNKKGSEKGRTICKISPFTDPFYYYPPPNRSAQPPLLDTPESRTLSEHSRTPQRRTAAWPGGEEREKGRRPSLTPSASPSRKPAHAKVSPRKEKPQLTAVHNSRKKVPANKDATTSLSYREELHRPEAPQGRTRPLSVTGSPISCDSTLPFQGFSSVASI